MAIVLIYLFGAICIGFGLYFLFQKEELEPVSSNVKILRADKKAYTALESKMVSLQSANQVLKEKNESLSKDLDSVNKVLQETLDHIKSAGSSSLAKAYSETMQQIEGSAEASEPPQQYEPEKTKKSVASSKITLRELIKKGKEKRRKREAGKKEVGKKASSKERRK